MLQLLDSCASATDCGAGLYCGNCPVMGKNQPFCIRGQATIPTSIVSSFPFTVAVIFFEFLFCFVSLEMTVMGFAALLLCMLLVIIGADQWVTLQQVLMAGDS